MQYAVKRIIINRGLLYIRVSAHAVRSKTDYNKIGDYCI